MLKKRLTKLWSLCMISVEELLEEANAKIEIPEKEVKLLREKNSKLISDAGWISESNRDHIDRITYPVWK